MKQTFNTNNKFKNPSLNKPYNAAPKLSKGRVIAGRKPMLEALDTAAAIDKIFILKTASGEDIHQIRQKANAQNIAISYVPQEKLDRLTKANHQGVVAIAALIQYHDLQTTIDYVVGKGEMPLFIVLDGITDTRNLGAIARSAHVFGAQALILPTSNSAAVTEDAVKTSAGALEHITVCRAPSIEQIMDILHLNGIFTVAMDLKGASLDASEHLDQPLAVIMGAEDTGVSKHVLRNANALIKIPQDNNFDSLNVSVAAGIVLYETFKNRNR